VPDEEGGPQRASRVAGGRLDPDVLERALAEQLAVRHAVQRDASGEHQVPQPGLPVDVAAHAEHGVLGERLDARRQIHVPLLQP
jgi:hypothetical protein